MDKQDRLIAEKVIDGKTVQAIETWGGLRGDEPFTFGEEAGSYIVIREKQEQVAGG